jgi:hypothetical protein
LPRLIWVPDTIRAPRHLKDFQRSWFEEIKDASFDNVEMQGYLTLTDDLWRRAGAHNRAYWNVHSAAVMACFTRATVSGQEVIFYPPFVELIREQLKKYGMRDARGSPSFLQSQMYLDFETQNFSNTRVPKKRPQCEHNLEVTGYTDWGGCSACYSRKYQSGCRPA